jgi:hypothetical protein
MTDQNRSATEETGSTPVALGTTLLETKHSTRAYLGSARRNLSEEELKAPGAIRLLISEIERLDERCANLEVYETKYHDLRVEKAGLEARLRSSRWHEVLTGLCLATGSAGIGLALKLLSEDATHGSAIGFLALSVVLVIAGIAAKVFK